MNECKHEDAALRIDELDEVDVCAICGMAIEDLMDNTDEED